MNKRSFFRCSNTIWTTKNCFRGSFLTSCSISIILTLQDFRFCWSRCSKWTKPTSVCIKPQHNRAILSDRTISVSITKINKAQLLCMTLNCLNKFWIRFKKCWTPWVLNMSNGKVVLCEWSNIMSWFIAGWISRFKKDSNMPKTRYWLLILSMNVCLRYSRIKSQRYFIMLSKIFWLTFYPKSMSQWR